MKVETKGIDVSMYQGDIDFGKVKASGVEFVIIKAGYGTSVATNFEINYAKAKAAGLNIGAYWYSYAESVDGALAEAEACVKTLSGKQFDYPIYFDLEEQSQFNKGAAFCTELVKTFCGELEKNGWFAGFYMSRYFLENYISEDVRKRYAVWVAEYSTICRYQGTYGIWQYGLGRVSGISGDCDMDIGYIDYPEIIKSAGLNGYGNPSVPEKPLDEIANEVIRGEWGSGDERKQRLTAAGYDYNAVQARVNELLEAADEPVTKPLDEIANEVIRGEWGSGEERKQRLTAAGYDYNAVQARVNELLGITSRPDTKPLDEIANEVIRGEWGSGEERKQRLTAAGYDYNAVQARVNELL